MLRPSTLATIAVIREKLPGFGSVTLPEPPLPRYFVARVTVPLVEGIENFQVEYGLDADGDGAPEVYAANPSDYPKGACAGACPVNNWLNVVTIRFHVLARNVDASPGYADGKVYELGIDDNGAPVMLTPGGPYRRHVFSSLVRIANASGRRDRP